MNIAVVGGGWAGLSAAVELVHAGCDVTVYESAREPGGRARRVQTQNQILDNGQHLLIGAYCETLRMIEQVNPGGATSGFRRLPLTLDYPGEAFIRAPRLPAPLHLAAALLLAQGLSWADKLAAIRFMQALKRMNFTPPDDNSVAQAIAAQPPRVRRYLWEPLCVAALNTPVEHASYRVFAKVLQDALTGSRSNSDFLIPACDLSALFPAPACQWLEKHGGQVKNRCRVHALSHHENSWKLSHANGETRHDQVILACSAAQAADLLENLPACAELVGQLRAIQYQPIVTVYADYPVALNFRTPLIGWVDPVPLFIFDLQATQSKPGRVAAVASASGEHLQWDDARWRDEVHTRMQQAIGNLPPPVIVRRISEKRATFSCTTGLARPGFVTPHGRLYMAGDYTDGPYPATLEGAVRSGIKCAQTLLDNL